jgi:hypothetical protein
LTLIADADPASLAIIYGIYEALQQKDAGN